jgi:hypothetical protein
MVPKPESRAKDTGCCFRDGFQDGILAVIEVRLAKGQREGFRKGSKTGRPNAGGLGLATFLAHPREDRRHE